MELSYNTLLKRIHDHFKREKLTLSIAESCTGGLIASLITDIPGASEFFDSSIITYSNRSKRALIGVKKTVIEQAGAVSEETARQMAEGVRKLRKTDYALSATGNLGPTVLEGKDVGIVYFAVASPKGTFSKGMHFTGTRKQIKKQAARYALEFLRQVLDI